VTLSVRDGSSSRARSGHAHGSRGREDCRRKTAQSGFAKGGFQFERSVVAANVAVNWRLLALGHTFAADPLHLGALVLVAVASSASVRQRFSSCDGLCCSSLAKQTCPQLTPLLLPYYPRLGT
jgi:hypothetical protein